MMMKKTLLVSLILNKKVQKEVENVSFAIVDFDRSSASSLLLLKLPH